jgi:hypothetical protein
VRVFVCSQAFEISQNAEIKIFTDFQAKGRAAGPGRSPRGRVWSVSGPEGSIEGGTARRAGPRKIEGTPEPPGLAAAFFSLQALDIEGNREI